MLEHFGVGRRLDGVMLVLISTNKIAQGIQIGFLPLIENAASEHNIDDPLGFLHMVIHQRAQPRATRAEAIRYWRSSRAARSGHAEGAVGWEPVRRGEFQEPGHVRHRMTGGSSIAAG